MSEKDANDAFDSLKRKNPDLRNSDDESATWVKERRRRIKRHARNRAKVEQRPGESRQRSPSQRRKQRSRSAGRRTERGRSSRRSRSRSASRRTHASKRAVSPAASTHQTPHKDGDKDNDKEQGPFIMMCFVFLLIDVMPFLGFYSFYC